MMEIPGNGKSQTRSPAADALSRYTQATRQFIDLRESLVEIEARAGALRRELATAETQMQSARQRLDGMLGDGQAPNEQPTTRAKRIVSEETRRKIAQSNRATRESQRAGREAEA